MQAMDFFAMRRISAASLKRNGIMEQQVYMGRRLGDDLPLTKCIAFPYMRGEVLLGVKYLSPEKKWKHVRTAVLHSMLDNTFCLAVLSPSVIFCFPVPYHSLLFGSCALSPLVGAPVPVPVQVGFRQ